MESSTGLCVSPQQLDINPLQRKSGSIAQDQSSKHTLRSNSEQFMDELNVTEVEKCMRKTKPYSDIQRGHEQGNKSAEDDEVEFVAMYRNPHHQARQFYRHFANRRQYPDQLSSSFQTQLACPRPMRNSWSNGAWNNRPSENVFFSDQARNKLKMNGRLVCLDSRLDNRNEKIVAQQRGHAGKIKHFFNG